jgi:hypothetical protein
MAGKIICFLFLLFTSLILTAQVNIQSIPIHIANGTSFGNLSGATFTVDAFKQSMESALAKF